MEEDILTYSEFDNEMSGFITSYSYQEELSYSNVLDDWYAIYNKMSETDIMPISEFKKMIRENYLED